MMTKTQFAKHIVEKYAEENGFEDFYYDDNLNQVKEFSKDIYSSSSLAAALNFLGVLENDEDKQYANSRGGLFVTRFLPKKVADEEIFQNISVAELLQLLPDKI